MDHPAPTPPSPPAAGSLGQIVATLVGWERRGDLGRLSALRAWWRTSARHIAVPVMGSLVGQRIDHPVWTAIPALFALHRLHTDRERFNLGATCRALAGDAPDTFATHFRRLLACDEGDSLDDLVGVLRRLAQRAQAGAVPINYLQLGIDLHRWRKSPEHAREVKTAWAKEYYRVSDADEDAVAAPTPTP